MERNETQCYNHFLGFACKLELLILSTEGKSDHVVEIIKGIEEYLTRNLDPLYNFKYYDMHDSREQKNILDIYRELLDPQSKYPFVRQRSFR